MKNSNKASEKENILAQNSRWNNLFIEIFLTIINITSLIISFINIKNILDYTIIILSIIGIATLLLLYINKIKLIKNYHVSKLEYIREQKINQINKSVFDSLYNSNSTKVREIFRYTYGRVPNWNPINYEKNVLVYDVHEHIRAILISIEEVIINLDSERFNEKNVSVELVYCYPRDTKNTSVPVTSIKHPKKELDWKLISSGDTSGNKQTVLEHLTEETSFFTLIDTCGTVFKNDKLSKIEPYQKTLINNRFKGISELALNEEVFFKEDIRDVERSRSNSRNGSAIGTVINIRNDNPEDIFVKAILTINTYGEPLFIKSKKRKYGKRSLDRDKFYLSEDDYKEIFSDTILSTNTKLLETELAQMYIRHSIINKYINPKNGRKIKKKDK